MAIGLLIFLVVTVPGVAVAAWQNDERNHSGRVARATSVAGIDVSGDNAEALRTKLLAVQHRVRAEPIEIGHKEQKFTTQTSEFGLDLNVDATQKAVLNLGHTEAPPKRFTNWIRSHFSDNAAPVVVVFDSDKLASLISANDPGPRSQPSNPNIKFEDGKFVAVEGKDGHGLINAEAPKAVRAAVKNGFPLQAAVSVGDIPAIANTDDLDAILQEASDVTRSPLNISAEGKTSSIPLSQLRPLMVASASGDRLRLDVDAPAIAKILQEAFPDVGIKAVNAAYDIVDDRPVIVEGKPGTMCCGESSATVIREALMQRLVGGDAGATVDLPMKTINPTVTAASIPDLGIKEKIATFTTHHPKNQPRVTNIHLISDLTRGSVIKPGETFSINNAVGKRTEEKGFVVDHVIEDGKFTDSVGGGISQYATTLFNAAFFGGLDFGEYQSHSIYISRYPYGREATVSFPHPDMQVKNNTPFGVLIWPTYTDSSLTVSLYSTKFATGAQTAQTTAPSGKCTRVRTERTRTYVDGHTSKDTVGALYQPKEGERC